MNNGVTVTGDLAIDGLASAKQFLTVSDMRVKKNIKRANGENDMRLLRKIKIHNYVLKSGNCVQKGVLAQEVEKHVPHIVHSIKGVLTSICDYKSVTKQGKVVFSKKDSNIGIGTMIKIREDDADIELQVIDIEEDDVHMIVTLSKLLTCDQVYVYGPLTQYKAVDTNYLFMTMMSGMHCMTKVVRRMQKEIRVLRSVAECAKSKGRPMNRIRRL
jgi:hypothetical protein